MNIGHGDKYNILKSKILRAALEHFLEKGYTNTTLKELAEEVEISLGSLTHIFSNKESLVCELVKFVIEYQFEMVSKTLNEKADDKLLLYATEIGLQLHLAESSSYMREMYVVSYSMEKSSKVVYNTVAEKLEEIFKDYLPNLKEKDFYEKEIAVAGIMRGFMSIPCDKYFTMNRKMKSVIETIFLVFEVPREKIDEAINFVRDFDFRGMARETIWSMPRYINNKIKKGE